jgi:uncharacterized protein YjiS (DUF1127 family)
MVFLLMFLLSVPDLLESVAMSYFSQTSTIPVSGSKTPLSAGRRIRHLIARLLRWQRNYRDIRHLQRLPDYLLRDIGLTRADIDQLSVWARYERDTRSRRPDI